MIFNGMVKIIQNYTLYEQIGEGEYGKVYKGIDSRNNKEVAVKVINVKKFKENPKLQQCTLNEIQVLSKIDCPYIVKFIEILKTVNNFYFFYEYCNSGTLQNEIKQCGVLPERKALQYLEQMLQAFKILASKNIMHRDLKPSNILIHDGRIKLGDFGFCKSLQTNKDLAQTMLGSPIYMAPEVLKGEIYTVKADIWSLGVVIYQMIYGFCPFEESSIARLINILDVKEIRFNPEINPISSLLEELIRKMLVKDHFKRISWDQIFAYKISDGMISRNSKITEKEFGRYENYSNGSERKVLCQRNKQEPAFDCNKYLKQFSDKENSQPKDDKMFKKKGNPYAKPIKEFALAETHQLSEKKKDDPQIQLNQIHDKLTECIKLVHEFISDDLYPELTCPLAIKFYQLILKEHYKLTNKSEYIKERAEITQTIRIYQSLDEPYPQMSSGPVLSKYLKYIQSNHSSEFFSNNQPYGDKKNKNLLIMCVRLLDFNELSSIKSDFDYKTMEKERLLQEFNQKLIKNLI